MKRFTNATKYNGNLITAECSDALYQLARVYSVQDKSAEASECLFHALTLNPRLAIEAQGDLDFLWDKVMLHDTLRRAESHLSNTYHDIRVEFQETVKAIREFTWEGLPASEAVGTEIDAICRDVELLDSQVSERRIIGTSSAIEKLREAQFALLRLFLPYKAWGARILDAAAEASRQESDATVYKTGQAIEAARQDGVAKHEEIARQTTHKKWLWNISIIALTLFLTVRETFRIETILFWGLVIGGLVALNNGLNSGKEKSDRKCREEIEKTTRGLQEAIRQCQSDAAAFARVHEQVKGQLRQLARPAFWT